MTICDHQAFDGIETRIMDHVPCRSKRLSETLLAEDDVVHDLAVLKLGAGDFAFFENLVDADLVVQHAEYSLEDVLPFVRFAVTFTHIIPFNIGATAGAASQASRLRKAALIF